MHPLKLVAEETGLRFPEGGVPDSLESWVHISQRWSEVDLKRQVRNNCIVYTMVTICLIVGQSYCTSGWIVQLENLIV